MGLVLQVQADQSPAADGRRAPTGVSRGRPAANVALYSQRRRDGGGVGGVLTFRRTTGWSWIDGWRRAANGCESVEAVYSNTS